MTTERTETNDDVGRRYRELEYDGRDGPVTIIQDTENERRWLQSTVTVPVRR